MEEIIRKKRIYDEINSYYTDFYKKNKPTNNPYPMQIQEGGLRLITLINNNSYQEYKLLEGETPQIQDEIRLQVSDDFVALKMGLMYGCVPHLMNSTTGTEYDVGSNLIYLSRPLVENTPWSILREGSTPDPNNPFALFTGKLLLTTKYSENINIFDNYDTQKFLRFTNSQHDAAFFMDIGTTHRHQWTLNFDDLQGYRSLIDVCPRFTLPGTCKNNYQFHLSMPCA